MLKPRPLLVLALLREDTGAGFPQGPCVWLRARGTGHPVQCRSSRQLGGTQEDLLWGGLG